MRLEQLKEAAWVPSQQELAQEQSWITEKLEVIGEEKLTLAIEQAVEVRKRAYAPYSGYKVGAAIICKSGNIHASCNAETATYTETDHAERAVLTALDMLKGLKELQENGKAKAGNLLILE